MVRGPAGGGGGSPPADGWWIVIPYAGSQHPYPLKLPAILAAALSAAAKAQVTIANPDSHPGPYPSRQAAQAAIGGKPSGGGGSPGGPGGAPGGGIGGGRGGAGGQGGKGGPFNAGRFLSILRTAIGDPYAWGGTGPSGFDCSGLVWWGLTTLGYTSVPRTSEEQWAWVQKIGFSDLRAGDLIFENFPGEVSPGHVLIYAGNGQAIQAAAPGTAVAQAPWSPSTAGGTVVGYGRIPKMGGGGGAAGGGGGSFFGGGILSWPSDILTAFDDLTKLINAFMWLADPSHWVRIIAGVLGAVFLIAGIAALAKAA